MYDSTQLPDGVCTVAKTSSIETLKFLERKILYGHEQRSECGAIPQVNRSEVKQRSERSQRFHFSVTYVKEVIVK